MSTDAETVAPELAAPTATGIAPVAVPNADGTATSAEAPVSGEETPVAETKESRTFKQEDVDDIVAKRVAKEQRKWQREEARRIAEAVAQAAPRQPEPQPAQNARPAPENFSTTDEYIDAVADWKYDQRRAQERQEQEQRSRQEYAGNIDSRYSEAIESAEDKYNDFHDAFRTLSTLPIPNHVALGLKEAIAHSDRGADLIYFLGKNTDETLRIAKLSPIAAAREIGKLEAKLAAAPPAVKPSVAPAPIEPVTPRAVMSAIDTSDPKSIEKLGGTSAWIAAEEARIRRAYEARHR